jgi:hypothetical protein
MFAVASVPFLIPVIAPIPGGAPCYNSVKLSVEVGQMARSKTIKIEGTPHQLTAWLGQHPDEKRYRLVEVEEAGPERDAAPLADPKAAASIALLKSWIAQAPTDPEEIRQAEEELLEFQRNMNANRAATGERIPYPDAAE